jgi:hypothetical protein
MAQESWLYVELERSGGHVPTFRPKFRLEVKALSVDERKKLDRLLKDADFFHQPARFSGTGHPDAFEYRLTVEGTEESHTVVYHDQDGHPESIDTLADWVRAHQSQ